MWEQTNFPFFAWATKDDVKLWREVETMMNLINHIAHHPIEFRRNYMFVLNTWTLCWQTRKLGKLEKCLYVLEPKSILELDPTKKVPSLWRYLQRKKETSYETDVEISRVLNKYLDHEFSHSNKNRQSQTPLKKA